MDLFRRVLVSGENSERSLRLSKEVINQNAANYTAWQYRRRCIFTLYKDASPQERDAVWRAELAYCAEVCLQNLKNYQVWFHRRCCVEQLQDASKELAFVAQALAEDAKNYHAWGHRQWTLKTFGLWADELDFVTSLLEQDACNNSAWNQRYFVLSRTADLESRELLEREVAYALAYMRRSPSNQSPWNYIRGLLEPVGFGAVPQVRAVCEELAASSDAFDEGESAPRPACANALALLLEIQQASGTAADTEAAARTCEALERVDPIRVAYWRWRKLSA